MKPIREYPTPEVDAKYRELTRTRAQMENPVAVVNGMAHHARSLEQRLAACRETLEDLLPIPLRRPYPDGPCLERSDWDAIRETLTATAPPP